MPLLYACAHADYSIVTSICDRQFQCQFRTTDFLRDVSVNKNTLRKLPFPRENASVNILVSSEIEPGTSDMIECAICHATLGLTIK